MWAWGMGVLLGTASLFSQGAYAQAVKQKRAPNLRLRPAVTITTPLAVTPATLTFNATDPDLGPFTTSGTATWALALSLLSNNWTLTVRANSSSFTNCSQVPVSAVTITCVSVTNGGVGAPGTCNGAFTLSTSNQQIASGPELLTALASYTVNISYKLADSWQFIAAVSPACTLSLSYTLNAP